MSQSRLPPECLHVRLRCVGNRMKRTWLSHDQVALLKMLAALPFDCTQQTINRVV
ncbi:hypothetical protein LINGRAHAP2_LOCUS12249, partial [Linum grandiflorum]